jgi:virginiamycin A acetyltransferase
VYILAGKAIPGTEDRGGKPIRLQPGLISPILSGDDTWIGNGATVMANVGLQYVIGAASVVVSDVPDRSIVAGNPARLIRRRGEVAEACQ